MSTKNVQFAVATHMLAVLGYWPGCEVTSTVLAGSVNAEPSFVRRTVSRLSKAGLIVTTRGKNGACTLARAPEDITLLEIYRASEAPATFAIHGYPAENLCAISVHIKSSMADILEFAQTGFEECLASRTLAEVIGAIKAAENMLQKKRPVKRVLCAQQNPRDVSNV
jgi:DNA-binding IscR family transcriptional regulator